MPQSGGASDARLTLSISTALVLLLQHLSGETLKDGTIFDRGAAISRPSDAAPDELHRINAYPGQ